MVGRRRRPDGLPFNLYRYEGKRIVSYGYKTSDNEWVFRLRAPKAQPAKVAQIQAEAVRRAHELNGDAVTTGTMADLLDRYFVWQDGLRPNDERRKAADTLTENKREANFLKTFFGKMRPIDVRAMHVYEYLALRADNGAPAKANKEISLLSAAMELARKHGELEFNPCNNIEYNPVQPRTDVVERRHIAYALREARRRGGSFLVLALAFRAAHLSVSRPQEIRTLHIRCVKADGLELPVGKRKQGKAQKVKLIKWSPRLRLIIRLARKLQRVPSVFLFSNTEGQVYTRSGWSSIWRKLMGYCEKRAEKAGVDFQRFALRDMRPTAITERLERNDSQITNATGNTAEVVRRVYDRRRIRRADATD